MPIVLANGAFQSFSFESVNVRIVDVEGDPWFVAIDILAAMQSGTRTNDALKTIREDLGDGYDKFVPILDSLGRNQETLIIHEAAVTLLISRSRTPMGKALNRHLYSVILPTIRKTGKFVAHPEFDDLSFKQQELKAARAELVDLQILDIRKKVAKLKSKLIVDIAPPKHLSKLQISQLLPLVTEYCEGKAKVSVTELMHHFQPDKNKWNPVQSLLIECLRQLNYKKNGERHRVFIDGENLRVYSWILKA
jgi:prophage antirepressor-like protein